MRVLNLSNQKFETAKLFSRAWELMDQDAVAALTREGSR